MSRWQSIIVGSICIWVPLAGVSLARAQAPMLLGGIPASRKATINDRHEAGNTARPAAEGQLREGLELVDQPGSFKMAGDRLVFFLAAGKQQLIGLENLNLERIQRILTDNTDPLEWLVTGTVAEFRGTNYLFVRRATFKNRGTAAVPRPTATPP